MSRRPEINYVQVTYKIQQHIPIRPPTLTNLPHAIIVETTKFRSSTGTAPTFRLKQFWKHEKKKFYLDTHFLAQYTRTVVPQSRKGQRNTKTHWISRITLPNWLTTFCK